MEKYRLLFESVFKRKLTDADAVGYLEKITAEHPYFSAGQFYLLQLCPKDSPAYRTQAKKTAALFNNNYWLNFQLLSAGAIEQPASMANNHTEFETAPEDKIFEASVTEQPAAPLLLETDVPSTENAAAQVDTTELPEETTATMVAEEDPVDAPETIEENAEPFASEQTATEPELETVIEIAPAQEAEPETSIAVSEETDIEEAPVVEETAPEQIVTQPEAVMQQPVIESQVENETPDAAETVTATVITAEPANQEKEIIAVPDTAIKNASQDMLFEPLHASDYFASVGIKLSEEEKTADKLGKQLKSFTDWLKTMKRTHAEQLAQTTRPAAVEAASTDSSIQKLAERSNQENDVVTEAMADVLMQQGRQDKAIEILQKLSLLNPAKSAYFAAKINQIKEK